MTEMNEKIKCSEWNINGKIDNSKMMRMKR